MSYNALWITGQTRSGKTTRLIEEFQRLSVTLAEPPMNVGVLVFAANSNTRMNLADQLAYATEEQFRLQTTTPLGFFSDEVLLFFPLLVEKLNLKAQFPVRLRPETEQELATKLWRKELDEGILRTEGVKEFRIVRRILDVMQLAAVSGTPIESIPRLLAQGMPEFDQAEVVGELSQRWYHWCLDRGLLTYGLICELYWRYLLPDSVYQERLVRRFGLLLADDVDEYPAISRVLFEVLLENQVPGVFTHNSTGGIRLGLGADPKYIATLAKKCQRREQLMDYPVRGLAAQLGNSFIDLVVRLWGDETVFPAPTVRSLQTGARSQLLRQTAETIIEAVNHQDIQPQEIAIIAPGLDAIARYTLMQILNNAGIAVQPLNEQRPLVSSPLIRALLSLLALVYPGNGVLLDRNAIAEMLVTLSPEIQLSGNDTNTIDPVRAGLIADHCYVPHQQHPHLLPVTEYPRWDRLGYQATTAYEQILNWIEKQREQLEAHLIANPIIFLDRAIQEFFRGGSNLPYNQLAQLRELMETAQHYWEVAIRVKSEAEHPRKAPTVNAFIQLLRQGTVTANPYPVRPTGPARQAVTLATIFQYRSSRNCHRWHFWLDVGSSLWSSGGAAILWGAPLFLQDRLGEAWTVAEEAEADEKRLQRILLDLLGRCEERLYLCHSELAVNGNEQIGPLLPLLNAVVMPLVEK